VAESEKPKTLNQLSSADINSADLEEIVSELRHTSDRTAAIVLGSLVERTVEQRILTSLPRRDPKTVEKLLGRDGPVSSF
jgi:hypothetical protein